MTNSNTQTILPRDSSLAWLGTASVEHQPQGSIPWRIDHEQRMFFAPELVERARMPAGVRLAFRSNSTVIAGRFRKFEEEAALDLCCDGKWVGSVPLRDADSFAFEELEPEDKLIELWLPQFGCFQLQALSLDAGADLRPYANKRLRWITYGSSISQCRTAPSPTQTWPALAARKYGLNLTCLGFGGQCHLDIMIARQIRDTGADLISLCLGINIYGGGSLNPRTFGPSIIGFVQIIREKHPRTPLVLMSPIFSHEREWRVNSAGFTLVQMRDEVERAVEILRGEGDEHIFYVNGLEILGSDLGHLLPDDLHPNGEGYRVMGERIGELVVKRYFLH